MKLPEARNPYRGNTAYELLGVEPTAGADVIRDAHEEKIQEVDDAGYEEGERMKRLDDLRKARDILLDPRQRIGIEIFHCDPSAGQEPCRKAAEQNERFAFEYERILKGAEEIASPEPEVVELERLQRPMDFAQLSQLTLDEHLAADYAREAVESISFER